MILGNCGGRRGSVGEHGDVGDGRHIVQIKNIFETVPTCHICMIEYTTTDNGVEFIQSVYSIKVF